MDPQKDGYFYFASESVGEGHPDKLWDQISDALVDAWIAIDPNAILGMEAATKSGLMVIWKFEKNILNSSNLFKSVIIILEKKIFICEYIFLLCNG